MPHSLSVRTALRPVPVALCPTPQLAIPPPCPPHPAHRANGTEHRRVYVLEGCADFLRSWSVGVGDAVGICSDADGAQAGRSDACAVAGTRGGHPPPAS